MLEEFADKCVVVPQGISLDYTVDNDKVNKIRSKYKDKKITKKKYNEIKNSYNDYKKGYEKQIIR